jgi:hypothetical protein
MALFSILHIFAFPWKPYDISDSDNPNDYYAGGFLGLRAILDAFNPMDFIRATARGFKWLFVGVHHREEDESYEHIKRKPGTLASGAKISGPYPLSPSDVDGDEFRKPHLVGEPATAAGETIELMGAHNHHHQQPKRQATDEFSDHTALLAGAQRMPVSSSAGISGIPAIDRSPNSTPPTYLHVQPVSPGLSPIQLRDPVSRVDSPPSPMDERMLGGGNAGNGPSSMDSRVRAGTGGRDPRGPMAQRQSPSSSSGVGPGQGGSEYQRRENRRDDGRSPPGPPYGYGQAF